MFKFLKFVAVLVLMVVAGAFLYDKWCAMNCDCDCDCDGEKRR